jgi:hypothetical protein
MQEKNVLIIDGQGGKIGKLLIEEIKKSLPELNIIAIGTNSIATSNMIKGGAQQAATGENPVITACRYVDVIIGPIGIVIADSLMGEVTPAMAVAVGQSRAAKILIPMNKCDKMIVGAKNMPAAEMVEEAVSLLRQQIMQ